MNKKSLQVELHCKKDGEWADQLMATGNRIDRLRVDGYEVNIKVIVDGTRRTVFKFEDKEL